ncbi:amidohydrolase protein [Fusarium austroafricanum]|uniref:Amidohydrolase protein n=1 Tax=Fusarium austroafricanum TaxID=2364996 RepID=A0A8H4P109_9HYPO|nr:amidohydrolase protein [Fusarium austroafricanum]
MRTIAFLLSGQLLRNFASACSFHGSSQPGERLVNHRRSVPGTEDYVRTAIDDIHVFNGKEFTGPKTVCMDGGYIADLGKCDGAIQHISGSGKFLLPGLFDNHLHLTDVQSLENFTSYGCTTAMNMNCGNFTQCHIMASQKGLSSFFFAGAPAVGIDGAHAKTQPNRAKNTFIYPDTQVTEYTDWQFGNGSNYHKITAEVQGPSVQQQIEMVKTAHQQWQKQTITHAAAILSYNQSIISRTDGIQHVPDDGILTISVIAKIKAQGQFVTPTLNVFEYAYRDPILQQYFGIEPNSNRTIDHAETNARLLYEGGVPLIVGTDSVGTMKFKDGVSSIPFGLSVHYELQNFVNVIGMSPAEAINAGTRDAAKWHRVPDRGSIAVGKRADLLMLNSNPLKNITNTLDIERVWVLGANVQHVVKRSKDAKDGAINPALTPETPVTA